MRKSTNTGRNRSAEKKEQRRSTSLRLLAEKYWSGHRKNSQGVGNALLAHLEAFAGGEVGVEEVTERFCRRFASYLLRQVRPNSAKSYLQKLHALLEACMRQRMLESNPMPPVGYLVPRYTSPTRAYLTASEVLRLQACECPHRDTKLAFLFACFTGLRLSDIETLRWEHIREENGVPTVRKMQVKTRREIKVPLNCEALGILSQVGRRERGRVFRLPSRTTIAHHLRRWAEMAGIGKHITFHVSRHSFATLALTAGVGIYTVSKLCGHCTIKTTEIYAHIVDSTLKNGVESISKLIFEARCEEKNVSQDIILRRAYRSL